MPKQTTGQNRVKIVDGFGLSVKEKGAPSWTELGRTKGDSTATLNFDKTQETFSDGQTLIEVVRNMTMAGAFELADLTTEGIRILSSGLSEIVDTLDTPISTIPDQVTEANWDSDILHDLVLETSSTDSTKLRLSVPPVITSVTHNATIPEVLVENTHYVIVKNSASLSGYSIKYIASAMTDPTPEAFTITIVYGTNTPVLTTTTHIGSTSKALTRFEFRLTYTDGTANVVWDLQIYNCAIDSGALQFGLKGVETGGVETMPIAFTGTVDTDRADNRQLLSLTTTPVIGFV